MPHSYGIRARTRHMFARNFREHGMPIKLTTYLKTYKVGDIVDIKANGAIHKGMPHKFYHGYKGGPGYWERTAGPHKEIARSKEPRKLLYTYSTEQDIV
ncbi:hypothetical protein BGX23_012255 [Mortierella sp. AD031]|nr:hypothetical protein BGX23_012255 [Mortierella sp. AD031]